MDDIAFVSNKVNQLEADNFKLKSELATLRRAVDSNNSDDSKKRRREPESVYINKDDKIISYSKLTESCFDKLFNILASHPDQFLFNEMR